METDSVLPGVRPFGYPHILRPPQRFCEQEGGCLEGCAPLPHRQEQLASTESTRPLCERVFRGCLCLGGEALAALRLPCLSGVLPRVRVQRRRLAGSLSDTTAELPLRVSTT